jgi:uncharacterized protein YjlB
MYKKLKFMFCKAPLIKEFLIKGNDTFPNSHLPVLLYKRVLILPALFTATHVEKLLVSNGWANNWRNGIYTRSHYHSNTHEVMACVDGSTMLLLGGENGKHIHFEKADVIIIPAGVAHKNLGKEDNVFCVGGYPGGLSFDMNFGEPGERPAADQNISNVEIPSADPVYGTGENGLVYSWKQVFSV